jgi:hypothetical protein
MKKDDLKELFKKAADIASEVPENMQQIAFTRALDLFLGKAPEAKAKTGRKRSAAVGKSKEKTEDASVELILQKLDRTKYPIMDELSDVLDRSLYVLRIAKDELNIDGFIASQIAKILTDKFRLPTSRQAVYARLSTAIKIVDSKPAGNATLFRIMQPGEKYLDKAIAGLKSKK